MSEGMNQYRVEGMTCQNCARHVREAALTVAGVTAAAVDLDAGGLRLRWAPEARRDAAAVLEAVGKAGFRAQLAAGPTTTGKVSSGSAWRTNLRLGIPVTAFLMLAEWGLGWMHRPWFPWLALALATPVQLVCGAGFYRGAWAQLRRGASNMDTLVSLGSTSAFLFSAWVTFSGTHAHVFFMESTAILTLISAGHWLEARATARATGAMRTLLDLAPPLARRLGVDGAEQEVAVNDLLPGDRVVIRPGDRVPADAEVTEGVSSVEESMLTGESIPVEKARGAKIYAGTANADGRLVARVTAMGEETVLARIVAAVERAQNSRAGIQRLADQVSSVFVPIVVLLALLTALTWGLAPDLARGMHAWFGRFLWTMTLPEGAWAAAVVHATSVLIVACPCAMGLATPAAIMAGTNAAAARGILIRDGVALEKAGRLDSIVFDKTGTLTMGQFRVTEVTDLRPESERLESVRVVAAGLARGSNHPVSRALAALVPETRSIPVLASLGGGTATAGAGVGSGVGPGWSAFRTDLRFVPKPPAAAEASTAAAWSGWREVRGCGIEARRRDQEGDVVWRLGSMAWLASSGVDVSSATAPGGGAREASGVSTTVGLAAGSRWVGRFDLGDSIRPEAAEVLAALTRAGYRVHVMSGDSPAATGAVARVLGLPEERVLAGMSPEGKAAALSEWQRQGRKVAFVGDGINDGPALAQADLGIAMSRATDVARESADLVLMRGDLRTVVEALKIARATLRTIRQNLFWAFFYNAASVPLAMLGFFSPVVCAAAMGLSDLLVIANALRLLRGPRGQEFTAPLKRR